jgi:hypothetical protein
MSLFAIVCLVVAAIAVIIFASLCLRPALRARTVVLRLQTLPALAVTHGAGEIIRSMSVASARFETANRRFAASAVSIDSALASVGGYAAQVAAMSMVIDSLLEFLVPRLRGMTQNDC